MLNRSPLQKALTGGVLALGLGLLLYLWWPPERVQVRPVVALSDDQLEQLSIDLSEEPGFFDTDNLISNEDSYAHVVARLKEIAPESGAYLGVGPDQNFTYLVHLRPAVAFVIDIRRNNLLQHLYLKQLIELSRDRRDFLARLFGKNIPSDAPPETGAAASLVTEIQGLPGDPQFFEEVFQETWELLHKRFPRLCRPADRSSLYLMARAFFLEGLDLQFRSHGRSPRPSYPTYGELMLETDESGRSWHYLNVESDFQYLRRLQRENRLVPVVGDLAGATAMARIGYFLSKKGLMVSAFYVSNVEFYLFRQGRFSSFVENMAQLPLGPDSLIIRSYFNNMRTHPESHPGYAVTSLLQRLESLLAHQARAPYLNYRDLVTREYLPLRQPSR